MKKALAILLVAGVAVAGLSGTADAGGNWSVSATWTSGGHYVRPAPCAPVVVAPAPVVYPRPVVYAPPVVYTRPVVYTTPVVYTRPAVTFGFTYGRYGYSRYSGCGTRYVHRPMHYGHRSHHSRPVHCGTSYRSSHRSSGHRRH